MAKTIHLQGRNGRTACGKNITHQDQGVHGNPYLSRRPDPKPRKTPLAVTADYSEVRCAGCQGSYDYSSYMRKRRKQLQQEERAALEARRKTGYRLTVTVDFTGADLDDAKGEAMRLFGHLDRVVSIAEESVNLDGEIGYAHTADIQMPGQTHRLRDLGDR